MCAKCDLMPLNEDDEHELCEDCAQNEAEAAYERSCEAYYGGGSDPYRSNMIAAGRGRLLP